MTTATARPAARLRLDALNRLDDERRHFGRHGRRCA